MPIKNLNKTNVIQSCGLCGAENTVALSALKLGVERTKCPDTIVFPPCPTPQCGWAERLLRTWDLCDLAHKHTPFFKQRCAVNALAKRLIVMKNTEPSLAAEFESEAGEEPEQTMAQTDLEGAGLDVDLPDRKKGEAMWAKIKGGKKHLHPSKRKS